MLDKIFHKDDNQPDDKEAQIQATVKNLTDQIGTLRQELQSKNTQIEQLQEQLKTAQNGASSGSQQTAQLQQQIADLKKQLDQARAASSAAPAAPAAPAGPPLAQQITDLNQQLSSANATITQKDQQIADLQSRLEKASSAPATPTGGLAAGGQAWVTREGGMALRLRSGAGLQHGVIGSLPPGSQMTLLDGPRQEDNYNWWHVRTSNGEEGWVAGQDLRSQPD